MARSNRVTITTGNVSGGTVETSLIYDVNGNGVVDRGDRPDTVDVIATGSPITKALGAGTYFVGITPVTVTGDEVSYNFKIEETAITGIRTGTDAPIGLGGAVDLTPGTDLVSAVRQRGGTFNLRQVLGVSDTNNSQLVGTFESTDIYRFTLTSEVNTFSALLNTSGLTGDLTMSLIYDENGNGIANPGEDTPNGVILGDFPGGVFTGGSEGGAALAINKTLGAGTYYLAITQRNEITDNTTYSVDLFANSVSGISAIGDPTNSIANSFSSAFNVGTLNQNVSYRQFVGSVDDSDLYTFTLDRPRNIIIRYSGSPELAGIRFGTDYNGSGFFDPFEDVNNNRILDPGEDLNGNGVLDFAEDINGDGLLNPGEDANGNNRLDAAEDSNNNGILDGGEDINGNGRLDRDVFQPSLTEDVVYSPLPPFFATEASFDLERDTFLTEGIATDIYARLPAGTYVIEINAQAIQTDLGDSLTRYGSANILYNLSFLLDG
ncbi:MAG: hypothetical protein HC827_16165 [Cyanobacteria bacterium RM1_2_2]|nr:hypothetical protein [Cyanobacteria bacterium RM1_2_2]